MFALAGVGPLSRLALLPSLLALTACGDAYFGIVDEGPPLPGERIAIMALDRVVDADPQVAALQIQLPSPAQNALWPQEGGDASHAVQHVALVAAPKEAWRVDIGAGTYDDKFILAQPLVLRDRVLAMDARARVSAYEPLKGKRLWSVDLEKPEEPEGYFGGGIATADGRVFVTTGFGMVFALDVADGRVIWSQDLTAPMRAAPTVSGGRVFVITTENRLFALDTRDGRRLWEHTGLEETTSLVGAASPAVSGSTVIAPYRSGELYSLLVENGRVLWAESLSAVNRIDPVADLGQIRGLPVIDRGVVLAISHSGQMAAIDLARGARAWEIELGGVQTPWVAGEFIYVVTNEGQVVCLVRRNGRVRWVTALPRYEDEEDKDDPIQWYGPTLAGERLLLAGSNKELKILSPFTGEVLATESLPEPGAIAPVVAGGALYILTRGAELIALR